MTVEDIAPGRAPRPAVRGELGDVLIYLVRLCDRLGVDPLQAARDELRANRRKYPAQRVRGRADKHSEYDL